jgi:hypothetical protein
MPNNERLRPTIVFTLEQESAIKVFLSKNKILGLRLDNYALDEHTKRKPDGRPYTIEEVKAITELTIAELQNAVIISYGITNNEHKTAPQTNMKSADAMHNARVLSSAIPELKPLFAITLDQHN